MLDTKDKEWITELVGKLSGEIQQVDQRLTETKAELLDEIRGVDERLTDTRIELLGEIRGVDERLTNTRTELLDEVHGVETRLTLAMENKYDHYYKLISEYVPSAGRSYERLEQEQQRQDQDIRLLQKRTEDSNRRIDTLERIVLS